MIPARRWFAFLLISAVCLPLAAAEGPVAPERIDVPGRREQLSIGQLFVPDYLEVSARKPVDLVVFFHGAAWCSEQNFYQSRRNAALVSISLKAYDTEFENPARFQSLLKETARAIGGKSGDVKLGRICLASFSGGYAAIWRILQDSQAFGQVTDVVLADSLYCQVLDRNSSPPKLNEDHMQPFLEFARAAARREKRMWYTHLFPPEEQHRGNTTTLTASYLIDHLGAFRMPRDSTNRLGMRLLYSCDLGEFHVRGFSGMTTQDHFNHFYVMADYLAKTSFGRAK